MGYNVVPAELVVKAMQDSGYKNAAYAIAELIDNSIQAGANRVELLCVEKECLASQRRRARLDQLAVLDNGCGMNGDELRRALQFGNGGHLADRSGIGRFGMGLPNSSMSQGRRVEVWTWQDGVDAAVYSYLDLDEIRDGTMVEVPEPEQRQLPKIWLDIGKGFEVSGTLVVWPKPDRCTWRTAKAVVNNSEDLVGRIYRRFLADKRVDIRMASYRDTQPISLTHEQYARPNDPLYLMKNTSCPEPFSGEAMFNAWGEDSVIRCVLEGQSFPVTVRYSIAKENARIGHNPGAERHGRHAAKNLGVSVVRADRELELDPRWMPAYDPVARWIGIEVEFPPELDEVFGVTNNKQSAGHLAELAGVDKDDLAQRNGYNKYTELVEAWEEENDPRYILLEVKSAIDRAVVASMKVIKAQTKGKKKTRGHDRTSAEAIATEATVKRRRQGFIGFSDQGDPITAEEQRELVREGLESEGVDSITAQESATIAVEAHHKYVFGYGDSNSSAFFSVKPKGGTLIVTINTNHPAYDGLLSVLDDSSSDSGVEELQERLSSALNALKLLLTAWARYEDELPDGERRADAQDARENWGRVARQFLKRS